MHSFIRRGLGGRFLFGDTARQVKASLLEIVGAERQLARQMHPRERERLAGAVRTAEQLGEGGRGASVRRDMPATSGRRRASWLLPVYWSPRTFCPQFLSSGLKSPFAARSVASRSLPLSLTLAEGTAPFGPSQREAVGGGGGTSLLFLGGFHLGRAVCLPPTSENAPPPFPSLSDAVCLHGYHGTLPSRTCSGGPAQIVCLFW